MIVFLALLPNFLLLLLTLSSYCIPEVSTLQGDSWCGTLMCVDATVNGSLVTYELRSLNQLGWMAIGFGSQMADTPMVILWPNANGSVTLSQRQASGLVEPLPVSAPPRRATLSNRVDPSPGVAPVLAFDIAKNNDTIQQLIWAFGVTPPAPDPSANIEQHLDAGPLSLNLTKELDDDDNPVSSSTTIPSQSDLTASSLTATGAAGTPTPGAASSPPPSSASASHNSVLVAHAALSAAGFLILLPLAALVARWARVFTARWFRVHWFINVILAIPIILIGFALGPLAVAQQGKAHVVTVHQICGVIVFALFVMQVSLGTLIYMRLPKEGRIHPPRNIAHGMLGLTIIGVSIFETKNGVDRDVALGARSSTIISTLCIVWAVAFAASYAVGFIFIRRQLAQERLGWNWPLQDVTPISIPLRERESTSDGARRRAADRDERAADDGTHDIFSYMLPRGGAEGVGGVSAMAEMREVQVAPVSIHIA
ncbi:hypothetical protein A0H81_04572 [Grifola frondosa]|uniref:Cytochrome b561 domain-containing protein n=1 Tax=Grifola frondosa TaxID=5627 RepID=A0A1C7MFP0_GRIFR|nr:hypothetical protein A0H81_04572 [Grifola frondosa]